MKNYKYSASAINESGAVYSIVLPASERRRSLRAYEDAARNQLGAGWKVRIWRYLFDETGGYLGADMVEEFTINGRAK
jgi:hypothetical protein